MLSQALLILAFAFAQTPEPTQEVAADVVAESASPDKKEREGFGLGVVPAINFNSDNGFGYGVLGTLYWYEKGLSPYKWALTAQIFMTTKWVQAHRLVLDMVEVGGLPLRLKTRVGYDASLTSNFCGFGNQVRCGDKAAEAQADLQSLSGEAREDFIDDYYKHRYIRPYGAINARWRLTDAPKWELMVGWRGSYWKTGEPGEYEPYPGSLYEQLFPEGETGFASVPQVGIMLDARDNEPAPTSGYWLEASVRGAHGAVGSEWDYVGGNVTLRGYLPFDRARRVVCAARLIMDGVSGDLPVNEMARFGGAEAITGFGGQLNGRGIRALRYLGRIKLVEQTELRWTFLMTTIAGFPLDITFVAFGDLGYIALDWDDFGGNKEKVLWGAGGGFRFAWDKNFIVRVDMGFSETEDYTPGFYIDINNLF